MRPLLLVVPAVFFVASAWSAPATAGFGCKYDGNQQEMNACAVRDYKTADASLNRKYKAIMSAVPAEKRAALRKEQRAWLKARDPGCKAEAKPSEGGSIWPLDYFGCLKSSTERRTRELGTWHT